MTGSFCVHTKKLDLNVNTKVKIQLMLKNYTKVALRNILRSKVHSIITLAGLSVGIACCILIVLFVKDEWTFDNFHTKADRIYRAWSFENYGQDEQFLNTVTAYPLGPALTESFNEVAGFTRLNQINQVVQVSFDQYNEEVTVVTPSFFDVFDFPVMHGKVNKVLLDRDAAILTRKQALKYFGTDQAIGETLRMDLGDGERIFTVKAVVEDVPSNSSLQFELIISELNNPAFMGERELSSWYHVRPETYLVLKEGHDAQDVTSKIPMLMKQVLGEDYVEGQYTIGLQPLLDIHLNNDMPAGIAPVSDPRYTYILAAIALLILFLGCVNFVTLSISRSINRSKEVGVRKAVGAQRNQLVMQFLCEAVMMTLLATGVGLLIAMANLGWFNELSGKQLVFQFGATTWWTLFVLILVIGMISGSYPALVLASFKPTAILKGKLGNTANKQGFRRVLVGIQFVLTISLVSTTLFVKDQLHFLQHKNLGFDKDQLAVVQLNVPQGDKLFQRITKGFEKSKVFVHALEGKPGIASVGVGNHTFGSGGWTKVGFTGREGKYHDFNMLVVDEDFIKTTELSIIQGRGFNREYTSDVRRAVVVNEAFMEAFNLPAGVGQKLPGDDFEDHEIIGVVQDFNYSSLHGIVEPLVMVINPMLVMSGVDNVGIGSNPLPKLFVRLHAGEISQGLATLENTWHNMMQGEEFEYEFVDQVLAIQYRQEQNLSEIVTIASALAMIIGCMGLFALASLGIENRKREVSIRKVLGASQQALIVLLSREYISLVLLALVVSIPITIYTVSAWLETFAYRIEVGHEMFLRTGVITLIIALLTISYHVIRTTKKQPADILKCE